MDEYRWRSFDPPLTAPTSDVQRWATLEAKSESGSVDLLRRVRRSGFRQRPYRAASLAVLLKIASLIAQTLYDVR